MATVYVASNAFLIRKTQNKMELSRKVLSRNARKGDRCAELCHGGVGSFHAACPVGSFSRPCHPYSASALIPNRRCRSGLLRQLQFLPLLLLRVPFPHSESLPTGFILSPPPCILKLNFYDSTPPRTCRGATGRRCPPRRAPLRRRLPSGARRPAPTKSRAPSVPAGQAQPAAPRIPRR